MAVSGIDTSFSLPVSWPPRRFVSFYPSNVIFSTLRRCRLLRTPTTVPRREQWLRPWKTLRRDFRDTRLGEGSVCTRGKNIQSGRDRRRPKVERYSRAPGMCSYGKKQKVIIQKHVTRCPEGKPEKSATAIPYTLADSTVCTHGTYTVYIRSVPPVSATFTFGGVYPAQNERRGRFSRTCRAKNARPAEFVFGRFRTTNRPPGTLRNAPLRAI